MKCATCGQEMVKKSRARLLIVGALMLATIPLVFFIPYFWLLDIFLALAGGYLIVWAIVGGGFWCRTCKKPGKVRE
jgi:hypothetical protein